MFPRPATLLVVHSAALGLGALPVLWLARREPEEARAALACAALYLLHPALGFANLYEFHPGALCTPLLLLAFLQLRERRPGPMVACAASALLACEDVALVVGAWMNGAVQRSENVHRGSRGGPGCSSLEPSKSLHPGLPAAGALRNLVAMHPRWIGIAALVALVGLIAAGVWQAGRPRPMPRPDLNPPDETIAQALRQARGDSAARPARGDAGDKSRWMAEVKGFDAPDLRPGRREMFVRFANAQRCTCGCGYTLAGCRAYDPTCPVSGPRLEKLLDSVRAGRYSSGARAVTRP